jgi:hypothetical protein
MQIAAEHPKAKCERAGPDVKERLLLDRIALDARDVIPGNIQAAAAIEPYFADTQLTLRDWTAMTAGVTANSIPFDRFPEGSLGCIVSQNISQRGHLLSS